VLPEPVGGDASNVRRARDGAGEQRIRRILHAQDVFKHDRIDGLRYLSVPKDFVKLASAHGLLLKEDSATVVSVPPTDDDGFVVHCSP
jgi:hypothetical protein